MWGCRWGTATWRGHVIDLVGELLDFPACEAVAHADARCSWSRSYNGAFLPVALAFLDEEKQSEKHGNRLFEGLVVGLCGVASSFQPSE